MTPHVAPSACFYFQVHQPYRLADLRYIDIGREDLRHFDSEKNAAVFRKVAEKCYLPANKLLLELLRTHPDFAVAFSLSGSFLDQCEEYGKDVLDSFRALAEAGRAHATGASGTNVSPRVEFLAETSEHTLASLKSVAEFCRQVGAHVERIRSLFGQTPRIFRNTELIFSNELAHVARLMGFSGMLAEGADHLLAGRTPNVPYAPPHFRLPRTIERAIAAERPLPERSESIHLLLKNYRLSDDIAFRFGESSRSGTPLLAETFADWIAASGGHSVNLFMDYETFGEHQWADTGIFDFLAALPRMFAERGIRTATPSQVLDAWGSRPADTYDAHAVVSWADTERDLSAWLGNSMQRSALDALFALEEAVRRANDPALTTLWRRLQTSDHFYYMCTKYWSDGDVHKYFSPYDSPYEAYRRFSHALCDLRHRLAHHSSSHSFPASARDAQSS